MKHPSIDELHNADRYTLIDSFRIDEMNRFLQRELGMVPKGPQPGKKTNWKVLLVMGLVGGVVGWSFARTVDTAGAAGGWQLLGQIGLSLLSFLLIIPIHEVIHAVAFKQVGAPTVSFGASLKSLIVYAYTQKFVHTMRELAYVAVMPFLVITALLIIGWVVWPDYGVFWGTTLLLHTMACLGDFVMIRYYLKNRHRTIYTYDDVEGEHRSYFFAENPNT